MGKHSRESKRLRSLGSQAVHYEQASVLGASSACVNKARWRYHELVRPTPLLQGWQGQHFFAWLLMWVNCPISTRHVEGALSVYVKPKDIFVGQGLLRFQAEALNERVRCARPQRCSQGPHVEGALSVYVKP